MHATHDMRTKPNAKKRAHKGQGNGTTIRMDASLKARAEALAARHGLKVADIVRNALYCQLPAWEQHGLINSRPAA